jgi:drug/metabolite transporter (DMT)-like permease
MSLVATVSAMVAAILPVLFSIVNEGAPQAIAFVGFALALVAVWLISSGGNLGAFTARELFLPVLAGTCFAALFILLSEATKTHTYIPLVALRSTSLLIMFALTTLNKQPYFPHRDQLALVIGCGVLDALGNIFFALAAQNGRLDIAVILTALYPAGTVFLAAIILKERINRVQWVGVGLALAAIVCLSIKPS